MATWSVWHTWRTLPALGALTLFSSSAALGQQLPRQLPPVGSEVRVLLRDSTLAHGTVTAVTPATLSLRRVVGAGGIVEEIHHTVPLDSVDGLWYRAGRRTGMGALGGACVGLLGGIYGGVQLEEGLEGEGLRWGPWLITTTGIGALLGAFVGHYIGRWETVPGW